MTILAGFYLNAHRSQYQTGATVRTRHQGCTWTSLANGADASTGGKVNKTPDQVVALVLPSEETNPVTPGWSLDDADLAASRLGVPFEIRTGWAALKAARAAGLYLLIPGDSDRFGNQTCSGAFDGDHCIGAHPATRSDGAWWIDDPICPTGRWELESVIRAYAEKFNPAVRFGVLTHPVPKPVTRWNVTITGYTPLYAKPGGVRVKAVSLAKYRCGRTWFNGQWWYRIVSRSDYTPAANKLLYFRPNSHTKVVPAP